MIFFFFISFSPHIKSTGILDFKKVKEALVVISKSGDSYSYDGNIYSRPITSSRASQILMKIEDCRWDEDIRTVAKQIKAGDMLSPSR